MGEEDWCSNKQLLKVKETNRNDENVCTQIINILCGMNPHKNLLKRQAKKTKIKLRDANNDVIYYTRTASTVQMKSM